MRHEEWLERAKKIQKELDELCEARERAFEEAGGGTSHWGGTKVQTTKKNTVEQKYISYIDYNDMIERRINMLYTAKKEIVQAINLVEDGFLRAVLLARYINYKTWSVIGEELNYSCRHIHRLREKAINEFSKANPDIAFYDFV